AVGHRRVLAQRADHIEAGGLGMRRDGLWARALPLAPLEPDTLELFLDREIARPHPARDGEVRLVVAAGNRQLLRTAPGDRPDIGIGQPVLFEHQAFGRLDLLDRIRNSEIELLARPDQALGVLARLEDFAAIGALALEHCAGIVQSVRQHVDLGVLPGFELAVEPDPAIALVHGNSHDHLSACPYRPRKAAHPARPILHPSPGLGKPRPLWDNPGYASSTG